MVLLNLKKPKYKNEQMNKKTSAKQYSFATIGNSSIK